MPSPIDTRLLPGFWLHSHEEDSPGRLLFRPESYPLPPARGRVGYEFRANGVLRKRMAGPTDRSVWTEGAWTMSAPGRITLRLPGAPDVELEIESLEPERMIVHSQ